MALAVAAVIPASASAGTISFNGDFTTTPSYQPWLNVGGGAQCANTQPSLNPGHNYRYRGTYSTVTIGGYRAGQMYNPAVSPSFTLSDGTHPTLEACDLDGRIAGKAATTISSVPKDEYIGFSVYVPAGGFNIPNRTHDTLISEYMGAEAGGTQPAVQFRLHGDGTAAGNYLRAEWDVGLLQNGSYQYNASNDSQSVIPTLTPGVWNSIVFHVHWSPTSGSFDSYHRAQGGAWQIGPAFSGRPTLAHLSSGAIGTVYYDNTATNYCPILTSPGLTIDMTRIEAGSDVATVESVEP